VTLEKVPGLIIDFSSREQNEQELSKEIEKSNVICLVYSLNDDFSKEQLSNYWLPKINEIEEALSKQTLSPSTSFTSNLIAAAAPACSSSVGDSDFDTEQSQIQFTVKNPYFKRPIVLVANKSDTTVNPNTLVQDTFISRLVSANAQIESCVQCSAKNLKNVPEVFYYAQKSVLYPTSPVYDTDAKQLTPLGAKCFTRIFKLCDGDNDGLLSDNELNEFQLKCFGIKLNAAALQEVKMLLSEGRDNLANNWITLSGFLCLQALFFKKGRHETSWTVLKKFGYDKNLSISRDYAYIK
jgi:Ras family protein T1